MEDETLFAALLSHKVSIKKCRVCSAAQAEENSRRNPSLQQE